MPKRIIDVIKELNVGLDTIVEFLSLKGENVEQNPNAKITDEQYELLVEEFEFEFEYLYDPNKRVYAKIDDVLKRSDFDSFKDKCNCNIRKITVPDLRRILNSDRSANPDLSYFLKLAKQLGFGLNQTPQTLQTGGVNQKRVNKNEYAFLDILKQYKEELGFVTNQQEQIRKERLVFLNEKVKEVSNSLKGIGVGGDIINEWLKKLVDSYTTSLDVSGKLIDECAARILKGCKSDRRIMEQSEHDLLLKTLDILKKGRDKCIELIKTDPYIHQACFKCRKSPAAMHLLMDRYYTDVLNSHFDYTQSEPESVKSNVARMVSFLIESELNTTNSLLGELLLREKKRIINEMLNTSDKAQEKFKFNCLLVSIERDREIYEDHVENIINSNTNKD